MKDLQHELDRTKPKKKKARSVRKKETPREVIACYAAAEKRSGHFATACVHPATSTPQYPSIMGVEVRSCNSLSGSTVMPLAA